MFLGIFQTFLCSIHFIHRVLVFSSVFKPVCNRQKEEKTEEMFSGKANSVLQHWDSSKEAKYKWKFSHALGAENSHPQN